MKFLSAALLSTALVAVSFNFASAQTTNRYGTWAPPGATAATSGGSTESLLKDLKTLVDEAEQARAADRLFLRDLRDLMARYERPWTSRVLFDDFQDGDFTRNPTWKVASGEYWVEAGYGLRSKAVAGSGSAAGTTENRKISKEELAISILGAVLQGANKNGGNTNTAPAPTPVAAAPAVLSTQAKISNAFALNTVFSSWKGEGDFAFAVTQGAGGSGYRLVYTPKQAGRGARLDLLRVSTRGEGAIDSVSLNTLEDKKNHTLSWTRGKDGAMSVSIDGKAVLSARDIGFRDAFDGFALRNTGADVIVKSVEVLGMP